MKELYYVSFTESEQGFGSRPDGYIVATTEQIAVQLVSDYCYKDSHTYSYPNNKPFKVFIEDEIFDKIEKSLNVRGYLWNHDTSLDLIMYMEVK